jgi:hypothetical protein
LLGIGSSPDGTAQLNWMQKRSGWNGKIARDDLLPGGVKRSLDTSNLYGDILRSHCEFMIGGLGVAPETMAKTLRVLKQFMALLKICGSK